MPRCHALAGYACVRHRGRQITSCEMRWKKRRWRQLETSRAITYLWGGPGVGPDPNDGLVCCMMLLVTPVHCSKWVYHLYPLQSICLKTSQACRHMLASIINNIYLHMVGNHKSQSFLNSEHWDLSSQLHLVELSCISCLYPSALVSTDLCPCSF